MRAILAVLKILAIILWSIFTGFVSMPYQFSRRWENTKKILETSRLWSKGISRIIGLKIHIHGKIPRSSSGGLVVSNHLSYIDILAHGSTLPLRYSPKSDIMNWPVLGWYIGLSRPIWINRKAKHTSKKALREFTKTMRKGIYLVVYPEGTSSDGKSGVLPFKSTSFEAAVTGDAPIIPLITRYKEDEEGPIAWYGDMTLLPHAWKILKMHSIEAHLYFLEPIYAKDRPRKELASYVHDVMSGEYRRLSK